MDANSLTADCVSRFTGHIFYFLSKFKYHIVIILGVLVVGVLDENSFTKLIKYAYQIQDLKAEIAKYETQYRQDTELLKEIKRNPNAMAKIARERYFMKADDEDIFVLSDDEQATDNKHDEPVE